MIGAMCSMCYEGLRAALAPVDRSKPSRHIRDMMGLSPGPCFGFLGAPSYPGGGDGTVKSVVVDEIWFRRLWAEVTCGRDRLEQLESRITELHAELREERHARGLTDDAIARILEAFERERHLRASTSSALAVAEDRFSNAERRIQALEAELREEQTWRCSAELSLSRIQSTMAESKTRLSPLAVLGAGLGAAVGSGPPGSFVTAEGDHDGT